MQTSKEAIWQTLSSLLTDARFPVALLSIGGLILFRRIAWKSWMLHKTRNKYEVRRQQADARKTLAWILSQKAQNPDVIKKGLQDIVVAIKAGDLSAHELLVTMMKNALYINEGLNSVTEPILESVEQAKKLDSADNKNGLLFGIPISLKESIGIEGYDATGGAEIRIGIKMKEDAVIVKVLKHQGAVPFVRTNICQHMISFCSTNAIYGTTRHPLDKTRSPGGSSSGEGALIGAGGSIIGIGSDIGGSVRVPGHFCGIYTLKTTVGRISKKGVLMSRRGRQTIESCMGPMARDFDSLLLLTRALLCDEMYALDPKLPPVPFNDQIYSPTDPLRIGYYTYDGNMKCQPPIVRAVMEAKNALERKGHELVKLDLLESFVPRYNIGQHFIRMTYADSVRKLNGDSANEVQDETLRTLSRYFGRPRWWLRLMSYFMPNTLRLEKDAITGFYGFSSVNEFWNHVEEFMDWQDSFTKTWKDLKLDAIVCPVFPSPALKLDMAHQVPRCGVYSQLFNSLNYPSGTVPVTRVTKEDVASTLNPKIHNPTGMTEKKLMKNVYDMEGLPVGVQCVALPFRDEMCLRVMRDLDNELRK